MARSKGPVHGAVDKALRSTGLRGLFSGGTQPRAVQPKPRTKPVNNLDSMRQAAKARMAVAKSYHARSGTTYDPVSGKVSGSGKTIGGKNTGKMYSTSRPKSKRKG